MASLATTAVADVARLCDVSVSVLHRWRRQLLDHPVQAPERRRKFTREFKARAMERIGQGATILEVAHALAVRANTIHRWRKEARDFGAGAFSGYGRTRSTAPPARLVKISLDAAEHAKLRAAFENSASRSLPDYARSLLLESAEEQATTAATSHLELRLQELIAILHRLDLVAPSSAR